MRNLSTTLLALVLPFVFPLAACRSAREPAATLRSLYGIERVHSVSRAKTALLLVDFEQEFFTGKLPLPGADQAARRASVLLAWARREGLTVVHVQQIGKLGGALFAQGAGGRIVPSLSPLASELVVEKSMAGGFTRTELDEEMRARGIDTVIIAGLMTHLAVDSTARDATTLGYRALVASDATATRELPRTNGGSPIDHALVQEVSLASLADRFADVRSSAEILDLVVVK